MLIVTHNGKFHADEVVAIAVLLDLFPSAEILRTRDMTEIKSADIAVDVGGGEYDHHQRGGNGSRPRKDSALPKCEFAAAGLVWRDYGEQYIRNAGVNEGIEEIHRYIDLYIIQGVDDVDNGVQVGASPLSSVISELNHLGERGFGEALKVAAVYLEAAVKRAIEKVASYDILKKAKASVQDGVIILERFCPWMETLTELGSEGINFVVWKDIREGVWMIQGVPAVKGSFGNKVSFIEAWGGLEQGALAAVSGIDDIKFCHKGLFIGGAYSIDSCLEMARLSTEYAIQSETKAMEQV